MGMNIIFRGVFMMALCGIVSLGTGSHLSSREQLLERSDNFPLPLVESIERLKSKLEDLKRRHPTAELFDFEEKLKNRNDRIAAIARVEQFWSEELIRHNVIDWSKALEIDRLLPRSDVSKAPDNVVELDMGNIENLGKFEELK